MTTPITSVPSDNGMPTKDNGDELASQLANYWLDNHTHDWRLGYERLFYQAEAAIHAHNKAACDRAAIEAQHKELDTWCRMIGISVANKNPNTIKVELENAMKVRLKELEAQLSRIEEEGEKQ